MYVLSDYIKIFDKYKQSQALEFDKNDLENFTINYVFNSAGIEGNTFTYEQTYTFLTTGQVIPGKSFEEHAELLDLQKAFKLMQVYAVNKTDFTEPLVMAIHKQVLISTNPEHAGKYKAISNRVANYSTPYPAMAKSLFKESIRNYSLLEKKITDGFLHPLELAGKIHLDTVIIHPFLDGNGRVARLLADFTLIKNGHPPFIYKVTDRVNYIQAIVQSRERKDPKPFTDYIIDLATKLLIEKLEYLNNKTSGKKYPDAGGEDFNIFNETDPADKTSF